MKHKLINLGCPPEKITKSIYGPDNKFLLVKPIFSEKQSFVACGRFVDKKAPYYIVLAIRKVAQKYPSVRLYFAGQGPLYETVRNLTIYFGLERNIIYLGIIDKIQLIDILARVTGLIQHSITSISGDMEGTPLAILEASASGIPVIATKHAGIPEVIIDGETGFLVEEHEVDGMADKIIQLIEDPELAKEMGQRGKTYIKENFSIEKHLTTILWVLEAACKKQ